MMYKGYRVIKDKDSKDDWKWVGTYVFKFSCHPIIVEKTIEEHRQMLEESGIEVIDTFVFKLSERSIGLNVEMLVRTRSKLCMNKEKIITSIEFLPLPTIVDKYRLSWLDLKEIFSDYNFDSFTNYERITLKAPYFVPEEKAYISGYLKASELALRTLFKLVSIKEVHDSCELPLEGFKALLTHFIEQQIKQSYEAVPLSKMSKRAVKQSIEASRDE